MVCYFLQSFNLFNRTEVALNKSSLVLKIILQNTQTLQLFSMNIKTEIILTSY